MPTSGGPEMDCPSEFGEAVSERSNHRRGNASTQEDAAGFGDFGDAVSGAIVFAALVRMGASELLTEMPLHNL